MRLILSLGFRNLLRQKRRNVFLGTAIAFGMMILVMANSFSHGISDTLLNRMVVYMTGHMSVSVMEDSNRYRQIIRDKKRFIDIIKKNITDIKGVYEAVGIFARVIGNAKGDNFIIVGAEVDKEFEEYLGQNLVKGSIKDFTGDAVENPVIIYSDKAKHLGVGYKDLLNMRTRTLTGQAQTARLTVAAILRSNNMFEGMAMFVPLKTLKDMIGLKPHETGELHINFTKMNDPSFAKKEAEKLYGLLTPGVAVIAGEVSRKKTAIQATTLGFSSDRKSREVMEKHFVIRTGAVPDEKSEHGALVSASLASELAIKPGDSINFKYKNKFEGKTTENKYTVTGVFSSDALRDKRLILLNEKTFYKTYMENLPTEPQKSAGAFIPEETSVIYGIFAPEWKLLPRTSTHEELHKKLAEMTRTKWSGPWMDVRTMYESADFILKFEFALKMVALVAVLILFFIILIGVLNTLRMTIRERTREIGTVRAIGMQQSDVKYLFITETLLLTAGACLAGIVMAFILMGLLGRITINTESVFSILLVDRRLYFLPAVSTIAGNLLLILALAAVTAYFPARRASNLSAVEALRHFE
jgi:ABC-type lipoprotein release transport system permease subunit